MPVVIYGALASPPVRGVLLTAKAIGLDIEFKRCNILEGENKTPEFLKMNPVHTVPTMDDNGFYLGESRAIMLYITQKYAKDDKLYPNDPQKRALVDNMLYFDASSLYASIILHYRPKLFGGTPYPESEELMKQRLDIFNTILGRQPYAAGDQVTLADLSIAASMSFPIAEKYDLSSHPNITTWLSKITQLPYYDEASKEGIEQLASFLAAKS